MKLDKTLKKLIKNYLDYYFYRDTGMKSLNGGWAEVKHLKFRKTNDGFIITGVVRYGNMFYADNPEEYKSEFEEKITFNQIEEWIEREI